MKFIEIKNENLYCIYVNKGINELAATNKTWHIKFLRQTKISNISLDTRKMQKVFVVISKLGMILTIVS